MENPQNFDVSKYLKELEKKKKRGLTKFYFESRDNKDFQEYDGKQYNPNYEYGGKILKCQGDKATVEIKNKLMVGDTMEILIPNQIEPYDFIIQDLWDTETNEKVDHVNPGKLGQCIKMKLPIQCEDGWILRRKKK